jgi:uncharacterized protein (TIGR02145 family)
MRKANILLIFSFTMSIFLQSCTKDSNGNVTQVVPIPPVDLTGTIVSSTQVDLTWTDKSTNESGFKIQRKTGTQTFADIGTTGKDVTNYSDQGLTAGTTYTYRVYSYNNTGNSPTYSNEISISTYSITDHTCGAQSVHNKLKIYGNIQDINGNIYKTIQIGTQVWMAENLKTTKYKNGVPIPYVIDNTEWSSNTTGAYRFYDNNSDNDCPYGKLYNWYTVSNNNGICPTGWHVPTDAEWTILTTFLGGESVAGGKMKSTGTQYWRSSNTDATNSSGFSGLPGVNIDFAGNNLTYGNSGYWWSSTEYNINSAKFRKLSWSFSSLDGGGPGGFPKSSGFSVRCVRD